MAESSSRLFNPSYASPKEQDPMLVQAPIKYGDQGARSVTVNATKWQNGRMAVRHVSNRS